MTDAPFMTDGLKLIGILVLIVGGLLFLNHYVRRHMHAGVGGAGHRRIRMLENVPLGLKKSIGLVQIPGAVLVLGITADRITLLDRIDGADNAIRDAATPADSAARRSFMDHLQRLSTRFSGVSSANHQDESR